MYSELHTYLQYQHKHEHCCLQLEVKQKHLDGCLHLIHYVLMQINFTIQIWEKNFQFHLLRHSHFILMYPLILLNIRLHNQRRHRIYLCCIYVTYCTIMNNRTNSFCFFNFQFSTGVGGTRDNGTRNTGTPEQPFRRPLVFNGLEFIENIFNNFSDVVTLSRSSSEKISHY